MEHPLKPENIIRETIAVLAHQLKGLAERLAQTTAHSHEPTVGMSAVGLIRPSAHQKVAIALHRAEWP